MIGKRVLAILGYWLLGLVLFALCGFLLAFLLACRHVIPPQSVAIVREVWTREGALFGPTALPFRIRIVKNTQDSPMRFFIQPPPFGVVEEVLSLEEELSLSFQIPFWRKDLVTGNPYDGSIARLGEIEARFAVQNHERFAKRLDPLLLRYIGPGQAYPSLSGAELLPKTRKELLREMLRADFIQRFIGELGRFSQSIHFKFYFAQKVLEDSSSLLSPSERKITIWKNLEKYPWYKLEPQEMGKIVEENAQLFEKILTYVRKEAQPDEEFAQLRDEIQKYFSEYIAKNPQSYSQELWNYAIEKTSQNPSLSITPEIIRSFTYQYLEEHLALLENLLHNEDYTKTLLNQYGVEMKSLTIQMKEDLSSRYPDLLK